MATHTINVTAITRFAQTMDTYLHCMAQLFTYKCSYTVALSPSLMPSFVAGLEISLSIAVSVSLATCTLCGAFGQCFFFVVVVVVVLFFFLLSVSVP